VLVVQGLVQEPQAARLNPSQRRWRRVASDDRRLDLSPEHRAHRIDRLDAGRAMRKAVVSEQQVNAGSLARTLDCFVERRRH